MAKTVPNQRTIIVKKTPCKSNFLQVPNEEWLQAAKDCEKNFTAFKLYLYLAGNCVGYSFALSEVAFENATGVKKTAYYNAFNLLKDLGYLVDIGGNKFEFYSKSVLNKTNSASTENSVIAENSAVTENIINSAETENSVVAENSAQTEKVYETFDF